MNIKELINGFLGKTLSDTQEVLVKVGDLKRLITEKNSAVNKVSALQDRVSILNKANHNMVEQVNALTKENHEITNKFMAGNGLVNEVNNLKEANKILQSLIETKNARLAEYELNKPISIDLYS